jgi:PAS domain S-box-containing protein
VTETAAKKLGAERVALLFTDWERDEFQASDIYDSASDTHSSGAPEKISLLPDYFNALNEEWALISADADADPRLKGLSGRFPPGNGRKFSAMDMPFRLEEKIAGALCHRRSGERAWSDEEIIFGAEAAAVAANALAVFRLLKDSEALRQSEEKYREVFENATDGIIQTAPDGRLLMANSAFAKMTGYDSPEKAVASMTNITEQLYSDHAERDSVLRIISALGAVSKYEILFKRKNGETFWALLSAREVRGNDGSLLRYNSTITDITERKLAEAALRESEEKFRSFVENSNDAYLLLTDVYIDCNETAARIFGMGRNEITGRPPGFFLPEHQPDGALSAELMRDAVSRAARGGTPALLLHALAGDGRKLIVEVALKQITLKGQKVVLSILRDITDRSKMEERIRQMEKMDAIGQLAGGIAHDFNNQLGGIMGYAELLVKRLEDPRLRQFAEAILRASARSADLTRQLLAFARKGKYQSVPVDVHLVINEVAALLKHSIDKRIDIKERLDASPCVVAGDQSQLQNALLNLGLNARDAMPGGGELVFSTRIIHLDRDYCIRKGKDLACGDYIQISVSDNGAGMSDEVKRHIFEPFFTTKDVGKGTGMGLASVFGAVQNHRGDISFYSEPGRGTVFNIFLPVRQAEPREAPEPRPESPGIQAAVLVVDDEDIVRDIIEAMLRELGYQIITRANGEAAVEFYKDNWRSVDLVIIDLVMPKMGGRDTFSAMKKINPSVKALLCSGYSVNGEAQSILDDGALAFIQKPFTMKDISEKVAGALKAPAGSAPQGENPDR